MVIICWLTDFVNSATCFRTDANDVGLVEAMSMTGNLGVILKQVLNPKLLRVAVTFHSKVFA